MSNKVKCHICNAKNTTDVCTVCGANIAQPVETKIQTAGGTLIESKRKAHNFTAILTNHRFIMSDLKNFKSFAGASPLAGALKSAVKGNSGVISINLDDIKSVTNYTKMTLNSFPGFVIELNDGNVFKIWFSGAGKGGLMSGLAGGLVGGLTGGLVAGMEAGDLQSTFIYTLNQRNVPYTEIDEKLPL